MTAGLLTPYTELLAQIVVVAAGCAVALRVLGRDGAPAVVGAVMLVLALNGLRIAAENNAESRDVYNPPGVTFEEKCLFDQRTADLAPYTRWLRETIPAGAVYTGTGDPCVAFQLLPRRIARPRQAADWAIHPGGLPEAARRTLEAERALPPERRTVFAFRDGRGAVRLGGRGS